MDSGFKIFVVDDDSMTRLLFESIFNDRYPVESFDSAAHCLERLDSESPDLFLLGVGLPDIDGYELCRRIKARPQTADVPVVFVSARDDLQSILAGYDAGGEEYVTKPFDVVAIYHKIENLRRIAAEKRRLAEQAQAADQLATLVCANLDDYAIVIKFLRALNECTDYRQIMETALRSLEAYRLEGAVQVRMRDFEQTLSKSGENWPLEIAVIDNVRALDRIFEFKNRAAFNFEHITILVTNMPVDNPEQCGLIRDNFAIAAESADAKLTALQSFADNARTREEIHHLLAGIRSTIDTFASRYDEARYRGSEYTMRFLDDLLASFAHLGMTEQQESEILDMVKGRLNGLIDLYDVSGESQATLNKLGERLEGILAATEKTRSIRR